MNNKLMEILEHWGLAEICDEDELRQAHDQIIELWKENLRGALARGYCTERNKHKILDPDLIEDMVTEAQKNMGAL